MYLKKKIAALLILAATQYAYAIKVQIVNLSDDKTILSVFRDGDRGEQTICATEILKNQPFTFDTQEKGNSFDIFKTTPLNQLFELYVSGVDIPNDYHVCFDSIRFLEDKTQTISLGTPQNRDYALTLKPGKKFTLNEYVFLLKAKQLNIDIGQAKKGEAFLGGTYELRGRAIVEHLKAKNDASSSGQSTKQSEKNS